MVHNGIIKTQISLLLWLPLHLVCLERGQVDNTLIDGETFCIMFTGTNQLYYYTNEISERGAYVVAFLYVHRLNGVVCLG